MNRDDLSKPFDLARYKKLISGLVENELYIESKNIHYSSEIIASAVNIGHFLENRFNNILIIKHNAGLSARVKLAVETFKLMAENNIDKALIAYASNSDSEEWRFSYVTITLDEIKGRIKKSYSNPRRYSYVLGPKAKTRTPYTYLIEKGISSNVEELQKRFSIEVVNNEFYKYVASYYDALVGAKDTVLNRESFQLVSQLTSVGFLKEDNEGIHYYIEPLLTYPNKGEMSHQFAIRLVGRLMFCWFLREKHSALGKPLVSHSLVSHEAALKQENYYHMILAPLFFETLAKEKDNRHDKYKSGDFADVPYLNGGLFSWQIDDYYTPDTQSGLSKSSIIGVPDKWLRGLTEVLERYNFTVDENTSIDSELSIDPEMLGRIFENLLARINPETNKKVRNATGSFYTPRQIVEYMVDESLYYYLTEKTNINENKLRALISYGTEDDLEYQLTKLECEKVVEALSIIKILDPACGSGAFPIGALQKIVYILETADPEAKLWKDIQFASASPETRASLERENFDYIRKLGVIRQSIFGVDIQPIATEIARLRCFLTLVVEQSIDDSKYNRGVRPLPNLDFKFITANTLLSAPKDQAENPTLFGTFSDQFSLAVDEYFSSEGQHKNDMLNRIRDLIDYKVDENIQNVKSLKTGLIKDERYINAVAHNNVKLTDKLEQEADIWKSYKNVFTHQQVKFFEPKYFFPNTNEGFDIVIGNPPYISTEKIAEPEKSIYKSEFTSIYASRTDIYTYFYYRGLGLTKPGSGLLCYITSNNWMRAEYGEKTRNYFSSKNPLQLIDFSGFKVFESATVDTNILLIQNSINLHRLEAIQFKNDFKKGQSVKDYIDSRKTMITGLSSSPWFIGDAEEISLKRKIENTGVTLKNWNIKISRGIITGLNEAFIIDDLQKGRLIRESPEGAEIIKPLLRGRDIRRFGYNYANKYVITSGFGMYKTLPKKYPSVYQHLLQYKDKLKLRGQCKSSRSGKSASSDYIGQHHWLELDNNPSKSYLDDFEKEKIAWIDLSDSGRFALVEPGIYLDKTLFYLVSDDNSYLLGVLNSSLINWYFDTICSSSGVGTNRWAKVSIEQLPIPKPDDNKEIVQKIKNEVLRINELSSNTLVEKTKIINNLVYQLYDLTSEEIAIIEDT